VTPRSELIVTLRNDKDVVDEFCELFDFGPNDSHSKKRKWVHSYIEDNDENNDGELSFQEFLASFEASNKVLQEKRAGIEDAFDDASDDGFLANMSSIPNNDDDDGGYADDDDDDEMGELDRQFAEQLSEQAARKAQRDAEERSR
jgi:hypothetical protein